MRYAICNEMFGTRPLVAVCEAIRGWGYQGLEIAPFTMGSDPLGLPKRSREEIARVISDAGLETVGLHWLLAQTDGFHLTSPELSIRRKTRDYLKGLIELCHDLRGNVLVLGSPQQRSLAPGQSLDEGHAWGEEVLASLHEALVAANCVLAIEPLGPEETNFWNTAADVRRSIERIDSPQVRLHLDVKAMSTEGLPYAQIIAESAGMLTHFHVNDPNRLGPGMGTVDYAEILPALLELPYNGWLSVEVFDFSPGPDAIAQASIEYLNSQFSMLKNRDRVR